MKAVVVGGTGFIGMNVVRALVEAGHDVVATRRARANTLFARKLGARLVVAELDDEDSLVEAMRGCDVAFMCAGHYPRFSLDHEEQVGIARRRAATSLNAAIRAGVSRFVLTSSVATIGRAKLPRTLSCEDDPQDRRTLRSVYFAAKHAIEAEAERAQQRGLDVVTLCPTGVVGELDVKAGTGFVFLGLATGQLRYYVDGLTNFVDSARVGLAHVLAAERGATGKRYIVAGHNLTMHQFLGEAADELGVAFSACRLPLMLAETLATWEELRCARRNPPGRPALPREFVDMARYGVWVDGSRATDQLGLPPPPSLRQMLRTAIAWYERFRYITPRTVRDPSSAGQPGLMSGDTDTTHDAGASLGEKA